MVPEAGAGGTGTRPDLDPIVQLLRHGTGVDFTGYKFNTLDRRITRRMVLRKLDSPAESVQCLWQTPAEAKAPVIGHPDRRHQPLPRQGIVREFAESYAST